MDKLQFQFVIKEASDRKTNMMCITSIGTPQGKTYEVPLDRQRLADHKGLLETDAVRRIKNTLRLRHESRKIWISLTKELRQCYLDEEDNVLMGDYYLEEIIDNPQSTTTSGEKKCNNLNKLTEKFVIQKFTGKNSNGTQWLDNFESECTRLDIKKDSEKIEALRLFLEGSATDWYNSMLIRNTLTSKWSTWKENFCETYTNKGWSLIRYAILYKYINGSLLDYALKKERILLETNKAIDNSTLIDLIAVGLPEFITDRINRKNLNTPKDLFTELGSLEHLIKKKSTNRDTKENQEKKQQKHPCKICEKKGKMNRYHPESTCWFNTHEKDGKDKNQIKVVNNTEIESELVETNTKN